MYMLYFYKLIAPYKQIGICGDSDDTGGFYLIIFHDKEQLLYWDITEAGILQQIINDDLKLNGLHDFRSCRSTRPILVL